MVINIIKSMKKFITLIALFVLSCTAMVAKDLKVLVVKTTPEMHCNGCETKIKNNIRFVQGVKKIETNLETKEVEVTYDADKTNAEKIIAAFKKIGYETKTVSDKKLEPQKVDGKTEASAKQ